MDELKYNIIRRNSIDRNEIDFDSSLFVGANVRNKSNKLLVTLFISKDKYGISYTEPKEPKELKNILGRKDVYKYIFKLVNSVTILNKNEVARKVESCEVSQSISTNNVGIYINLNKDKLKSLD